MPGATIRSEIINLPNTSILICPNLDLDLRININLELSERLIPSFEYGKISVVA